MNFDELVDELYARGTDYLDEDAASRARAERWVNQSIKEICALQMWPFLQATATDDDPISIPDLRRIRVVVDGRGLPLSKTTLEEILGDGRSLTEAGDPTHYWVEAGNIIHPHPVGGTLTIYYIKRVTSISGTTDPPFDEEYHDLIVDRAMVKAYKDTDNFEAATALKAEYDAGVSAMAEDFMVDSRDVTYIDPQGTDQ